MKGVTIPSQVRYVHYYSKFLRNKLEYKSVPLLLTKITFKGMPNFGGGSCSLSFCICCGGSCLRSLRSAPVPNPDIKQGGGLQVALVRSWLTRLLARAEFSLSFAEPSA